MNRLSTEKRAQIVGALVEGNSIRATVRMTGAAKNTIVKLLADLGLACSDYQNKTLRHLSSKRIECDEIWAFVGAKKKNVQPPILRTTATCGRGWPSTRTQSSFLRGWSESATPSMAWCS